MKKKAKANKREKLIATFKKPQGRQPYVPTRGDREFVTQAASIGIPHDNICLLISTRYGDKGMSLHTLYKYFRDELDHGHDVVHMEVTGRLMGLIRANNTAAIIFWLKTRGRWATQLNLADPNGQPLGVPQVQVMFGTENEELESTVKALTN